MPTKRGVLVPFYLIKQQLHQYKHQELFDHMYQSHQAHHFHFQNLSDL